MNYAIEVIKEDKAHFPKRVTLINFSCSFQELCEHFNFRRLVELKNKNFDLDSLTAMTIIKDRGSRLQKYGYLPSNTYFLEKDEIPELVALFYPSLNTRIVILPSSRGRLYYLYDSKYRKIIENSLMTPTSLITYANIVLQEHSFERKNFPLDYL